MREVATGGTFPVTVLRLLLAVFVPAQVAGQPQFAVQLQDGTIRCAHGPATCAFGKCVWNDVHAGRPVSLPANLVDLSRTQTGRVGSPVKPRGSFTFASAAREGGHRQDHGQADTIRRTSVREPELLHVQHIYPVVQPVYLPVEKEQPRGRAYGREGLRLLIARNEAKREIRGAELAVLTSSVSVARTERLVPYLKAADRRDRAEWRLAVARAKLARAEEARERGRDR